MDWDQDKGVFYFIDTADSVVRSYPVDENGVPKRSQDGVLLGVREVSVCVHHSVHIFLGPVCIELYTSLLSMETPVSTDTCVILGLE